MYVGHGKNIPISKLEKQLRSCENTAQSLYLPDGNSNATRWVNGVERLYVVRESQEEFYSRHLDKEKLDGFEVVVMPEEFGLCAGNRREWVRTKIPFNGAKIRIQTDSDFENIGLNFMYSDPWWSHPLEVSEFLAVWVLHFQHYKYDFAGFNDRENRPGVIPHLYPGHPLWQPLAYFKETLTIESCDCAGRYPKDWDYKEGAYRILDTHKKGGKAGRFFPTAHYRTRPPAAYETEEADKKAIRNLCSQFEEDLVFKNKGKGLGLAFYGERRNKKRRNFK